MRRPRSDNAPARESGAARLARWRYAGRLLGLLWELDRRDVVLMLGLSCAGGIVPLATVLSLQALVDSSVALLQRGAGVQPVLVWAGALFVANMAGQLLAVAQHWLGDDIHERLKARVQEQLLATTGRVALAAFEAPELYDQLHRAQRGVERRLLTTLQQLVPIPATLVTIVSLFAYLASAHPLLPVVLLAVQLPIVVTYTRTIGARYLLERRHSGAERYERYFAGLLTERPAAAEIRLFDLRGHFVAAWQRRFGELAHERVALARREAGLLVMRTALEQLLVGLILAAVVALILAGRLSVGFIAGVFNAVGQMIGALYTLMWSLANVDADLRYVQDLLDFLALGRQEAPPSGPDPAPVAAPAPPPVRFEDVGFSYPGAAQPALEGISLTLAPGERVALVGANGAGKTTLARLLLGLYDPSSGTISLGDVGLASCDRRWWRAHMAAVFQDFVRYELTAGENIGFGDVRRMHEQPAVEQAARRSGSARDVEHLPAGYATTLGKAFEEHGVDLSGGQWQRLALARAYFRDAPIVVLDEPTAALDARAEAEVYRQFSAAAAGRSMLLISHRLASARLADRIIVLERGRIVESGTHAELLGAGGVYAAMYRAQAQWYA